MAKWHATATAPTATCHCTTCHPVAKLQHIATWHCATATGPVAWHLRLPNHPPPSVAENRSPAWPEIGHCGWKSASGATRGASGKWPVAVRGKFFFARVLKESLSLPPGGGPKCPRGPRRTGKITILYSTGRAQGRASAPGSERTGDGRRGRGQAHRHAPRCPLQGRASAPAYSPRHRAAGHWPLATGHWQRRPLGHTPRPTLHPPDGAPGHGPGDARPGACPRLHAPGIRADRPAQAPICRQRAQRSTGQAPHQAPRPRADCHGPRQAAKATAHAPGCALPGRILPKARAGRLTATHVRRCAWRWAKWRGLSTKYLQNSAESTCVICYKSLYSLVPGERAERVT